MAVTAEVEAGLGTEREERLRDYLVRTVLEQRGARRERERAEREREKEKEKERTRGRRRGSKKVVRSGSTGKTMEVIKETAAVS